MSRESLMVSLTLVGGVALGALTMYFFDPASGRRRRTLCMDKLNGAANTMKDAAESTAHDLTNRARGVLAEAKSALRRDPSREPETAQGEMSAA